MIDKNPNAHSRGNIDGNVEGNVGGDVDTNVADVEVRRSSLQTQLFLLCLRGRVHRGY